jgi:hypothetical protein
MKWRLFVFALSILATTSTQAGVSKPSSHTAEIEDGFTDNLKLGLEGKFQRKSKDANELKFYGIEAQYELTQQGHYWLASAVKAEYARALQEKDADELEVKALLARTIDKTNVLANVSIARELGHNRESGLSLGAKLQAVQSLNEHINPGFEWHGDFGKINKLGDNDVSEHYVGPIITGDLFKLAGGEIEYTAGYYWGVSDDAADNAARVQIAYEIKF